MKINRSHIFFGILLTYLLIFSVFMTIGVLKENRQEYEARKEYLDYKEQFIDGDKDEKVHRLEIAQNLDDFQSDRMLFYIQTTGLFLSAIICMLLVWNSVQKDFALARQQQNFLQSITHELKSPIASIRLSLETLKRRKLREDQAAKLTDNAIKDVERLHNLVDNLLLATKIENAYSWSLNDLDVIELTDRIIAKMQQRYPYVEFKTRYTANQIQIKADKTAFTSLAVNLIENAVKYSPKDRAQIKVTVRKGSKNFDYEVSDHGIGIPQEERNRIFSKFYRIGNENTRKTKGTGLGLHIVHEIVRAHRGYIHVKENQPNGTIFRVTMPIKLNKVLE